MTAAIACCARPPGPGIAGAGPVSTPAVPMPDIHQVMAQMTSVIEQLGQVTAQLAQVIEGLHAVRGAGPTGCCGQAYLGTAGVQLGGAQASPTTYSYLPEPSSPAGSADQATAIETAPPTSSLRQRILEIARGEVGVREEGGSNRGPRVREYQDASDLGGTGWPWCVAFVQWVMREAGNQLEHRGASVQNLKSWAEDTDRWIPKSDHASVQPGDMIIYSNRGKRPDHIALVERVEGGRVYTIGGNESNSVRESDRSVDSGKILGYVRAD